MIVCGHHFFYHGLDCLFNLTCSSIKVFERKTIKNFYLHFCASINDIILNYK